MSTAAIVNIALTGVLGLFIIVGAIVGAIRGVKKTLVRGAWLAIWTAILVLFLSGLITNLLMNINLTVEIDGVQCTGVKEIVAQLIANSGLDTAAVGESMEAIINAAVGYVGIIINSIIFVLLFWLLKWLLLPINALIYRLLPWGKAERKYKKEKKAYKKYVKQYKKLHKGEKPVEAMGFADLSEDEKLLAGKISEIKEKTALESLREARASIENQEKIIKNEKLGLDVDDAAKVIDEAKEELTAQEDFKPKEEYKPEVKEEKLDLAPVAKPKKLKKHRLLGMLVGAVMGIFIGAITLSPAVGVLKLAKDINSSNEVELEDGTKKGLVDYLTQDMFSEINSYYEGTIGAKALTYTGGEWVATATFGALTRGKIDGVDADLAKDAKNIVAIASLVNTLTTQVNELQENNYQPDLLRKVIKNIDKIIDYAFDVSIVSALAPYAMQIVANEIEKSAQTNTETPIAENANSSNSDDDINKILVKFASTVAKFDNSDDIKSELKSFVKVVEMLNYGVNVGSGETARATSLLSELLKSTNNSDNAEVTRTIQKLNYEYYTTNNKMYFTSLVEKCYKVDDYEAKAIPEVMPMGVEVVLKALLKEAGVDNAGDVLAGDSKETVKNFLVSTFNEAFAVLLELNTGLDADGNTIYIEYNSEADWGNITLSKISKNMFTSLGKILDNIVSLVNIEVYQEAIDSVAKSLNAAVVDAMGESLGGTAATQVGNNIEAALKSFTEVNSFATEFAAIGDVYQTIFQEDGLFSGEFAFKDKDSWEWNINNLSLLGEALDALQETKMLGYVNTGDRYNTINIIFTAMLDKVKGEMVDTTGLSLNAGGYIEDPTAMEHATYNIINLISNNISAICDNGKIDWSDTFDKSKLTLDVITDIVNMKKSEETDTIDMVLDILSMHTITEMDGNANDVVKGALDEIDNATNTAFSGLVSRVLTDFRAVLNSQYPEADNKEISKILNALFDTLQSVKSGSVARNTYQYHLNTIKEAYEYINDSENGLGGLDNIDFDTKNLGKLAKILNIITKKNTSENSPIPLVSNSTICGIVADAMQEQLIDGSNNIRTMISDTDISIAMEDFVSTIIANIRTGRPFYLAPTDGWVGVTEALSYIVNNCLDGGNIDFANTADTSDKIGAMMDVLTGKKFSVDTKEYQASIVDQKDVKLLLGKIIAKKMSSMTIDANIQHALMGAVFSVPSQNSINTYGKAINEYVYGKDTTDNIFVNIELTNASGSKYNLDGICQKIFNFDVNNYSWKVAFNVLLNLTNTEFSNAGLGTFSKTGHTYYTSDTETSGFGATLDNMLSNQWKLVETMDIITLDQIKYILQSAIANNLTSVEDGDAKSALDTIANNVKNIDTASVKSALKTSTGGWNGEYFDTQTKALQYAIDIMQGYTDAADQDAYIADLGTYLDEIDNVTLTNGLGKTFVVTILNKIGNDTTDDSIATTINTAVARLRGESTNAESLTKVFLQNNEARVEALYAGKNNAVYSSLSKLKIALNDIDFDNYSISADIMTEYNDIRNKLINISTTIQQLQSNDIVGTKDARYIAIAVIDKLITSIDNIASTKYSELENRAYGHITNEGVTGYKQYLIDRLSSDATELYADITAEVGSVPYYNNQSDVAGADYTDLYKTKNYIIVYILDDYYNYINKLGA